MWRAWGVLGTGKRHSAGGVLNFIDPIVKRCRVKSERSWRRGGTAFADPEVHKYCEGDKLTCFIRLPSNEISKKFSRPALRRPVGRPSKPGLRVKVFAFRYQAKSWDKPRLPPVRPNHAGLKTGVLAYNLLPLMREFYIKGGEVKGSMEWLIRRVGKTAAPVARHSRRWWVHVASAFPWTHHYRAVLGTS